MAIIDIDIDYDKLAKMTAKELAIILQPEKTESIPQKLFGIKGLAEYLGCTPKTAQSTKNSGKLVTYNAGRKVFFYANEVDNCLKSSSKPIKKRTKCTT